VGASRIFAREQREGELSPIPPPGRRQEAPQRGPSDEFIRLQRLAGNRALLASLGAQAALQVGAVDDPLEHEADVVAEQVVAHLQRSAQTVDIETEPGEGSGIARSIRRRGTSSPGGIGSAGGTLDEDVEAKVTAETGRGAPLEASAREKMEDAFGADFSGVRIHRGATATDLNHRLGARAFTLGSDIFFRGPSPDVATPDGQRLLAHELAHTVQQGAAPAIGRRVHRAEETQAEESEEEAPEIESEDGGTESIAEGEIPETEEAIDGPPPGIESDRSHAPDTDSLARRAGKMSSARTAGPGRAYRLNVSSLDLTTSQSEEEHVAGDEADKVVSDPTVTTSIGTHKEDDAFGALSRGWKTGSVSYNVVKGATDASLNVKASFKLQTTWGVTSGGNKDIPDASSSLVKADTYQDIVADLTPQLDERSWVAPRATYWSKKLCERHEKFHATDVTSWAKQQGKAFLADYLSKKTVTLTDEERKSKKAVKPKVKAIVKDAQEAVQEATNTYMRGTGLTYYSYPGEERAFGDGKAPYEALAAAVKERGEKLKAAQDKKDAAKADKAAPKVTPPVDGGTKTG